MSQTELYLNLTIRPSFGKAICPGQMEIFLSESPGKTFAIPILQDETDLNSNGLTPRQ